MFAPTDFDNAIYTKYLDSLNYNGKHYSFCKLIIKVSVSEKVNYDIEVHGSDTKTMRRKRITYKQMISEEELKDWISEFKIKCL